MSHPIVTTITLSAGNAALIAASQTPGVAGPLTLTSATVTLSVPRRLIVTSGGNDSGITYTFTGTSRPEQGGGALVETVTGANVGAAQTTQDFATVTSVVANGAPAGTVEVGTNTTASGPWVVWDSYQTPSQISLQGNVLSGAPTYQVDITMDDPFGTWLPSGVAAPRPTTFAGMAGVVANAISNIPTSPRASRLTLTAAGGVQLTQQQQGRN